METKVSSKDIVDFQPWISTDFTKQRDRWSLRELFYETRNLVPADWHNRGLSKIRTIYLSFFAYHIELRCTGDSISPLNVLGPYRVSDSDSVIKLDLGSVNPINRHTGFPVYGSPRRFSFASFALRFHQLAIVIFWPSSLPFRVSYRPLTHRTF